MEKNQGHIVRGRTISFKDNPANEHGADCVSYQEQGAIAIGEDGLIVWCGPTHKIPKTYRKWPVTDFGQCLVMPGFVDAHIHFPQYRMVAAYGSDLMDWLNRYTFVEEQLFHDPNHATMAAKFFLDELLRHGITSALTFSTIHTVALDALFFEAIDRNMTIISGKTLMDRNAPTPLCDSPESDYATNKSLIQKWENHGRIGYAITPRFAVTSTERQLEVTGTLVREHPDLIMQTHLSESRNEIEIVAKEFPWSKDYTDVYDRFGLLGSNSIFAHGIHLSDRELTKLRESNSAIVHCPTSNNFLGSGLFRLKQSGAALQPGKVGIGSDVGGGTSFSMLQTLADTYKVSQLTGNRITAFDGFYMATIGNAKILGIDEFVGTLDHGKFADLVVLDPCATPILSARNTISGDIHDVLFALMILGDDRAVKQTYVAGKALKPQN